MEKHQKEQEQKQPSDEQILQELIEERDGATTGVPVVRANTPRPLSFAHPAAKGGQVSATSNYTRQTDFPIEAPDAPPLPEEPEESEGGSPVATAALPVTSQSVEKTVPEFTWLFEYGLEMDPDYLNSPARLNGQAHFYGPAVLKSYQIESRKLQNGQVILTLTRTASPEHEVWGILYRIPRRLTEQSGSAPSALDTAHADYSFAATSVVVLETYRRRPVQCVTYMLPEAALHRTIPHATVDGQGEHAYAQRLLEVAQRQKLPEMYLKELAALVKLRAEELSNGAPSSIEQNTEPLPVIAGNPMEEQVSTLVENTTQTPTPGGWLFALALYLVALLMAALALAVTQALGYWSQVFSASFAPLGAPWYVLLYGLLGGCVSCMMTLGRSTRPGWPGFVVLTWFARPFLGAVLAALAYLALSSGAFVLSVIPTQRYAIFSVVGAIAGLCEGWLFFRQKRSNS